MKLFQTQIEGVKLVQPERLEDDRGFFARTWCDATFETNGLNGQLRQCNISFNNKAGTLRGMHLQLPPHEEAKLVRCTMGIIYDVVLDLRPESETYLQWEAFELSAANRFELYIPEGIAHGFQTLSDNAEVFYQMSETFHPELSVGYRWDDPAFRIEWPLEVTAISERDQQHAYFEETKKQAA